MHKKYIKVITKSLIIVTITAIVAYTVIYSGAAIAKPNYPVLKKGSIGAEVYALQYLLHSKGYSNKPDGIFGTNTRNLVLKFQKNNKLQVDGVVGKKTWTKLIKKLKSGSSGSAVKAMQHLLLVKYSYKTVVDGKFGSKSSNTYKSVIDYQKNRIGSSDGVVGQTTWQYLLGDTSKSYSFWKKARSNKWVHPLKGGPIADPTASSRYFGSNRTSVRQHAGVDFIGKPGTNVYAMTSGTVLRVSYFDIGLEQVVIKNSDGSIVRYAELIYKKNGSLSAGKAVAKGQVLGTIERNNTSARTCMLHLEVYSGANGYNPKTLTSSGNKTYKYLKAPPPTYCFNRRSDLINPMGAMYLTKK